MRCKAGDVVYVQHAAVDSTGRFKCACHVGLIFTVRDAYKIPAMPTHVFWKCPLTPRCAHFLGGVEGFDDQLLKPIRGETTPAGVRELEKVDG
jgi:hypothetical protein